MAAIYKQATFGNDFSHSSYLSHPSLSTRGPMKSPAASPSERPTQADRRNRTRAALIVATAEHITRFGYADMVLDRVASDAGYTRGALYHLFANKTELTLATVDWVYDSWREDIAYLCAAEGDPVVAVAAVARSTAVYLRRADLARAIPRLAADFSGVDHPVGRRVRQIIEEVLTETVRLITAAQRSGAIPTVEPPRELALACLGSVNGVLNAKAGQNPYDALLAERAALGVLGLLPKPEPVPGDPIGDS
jgi:AcrR family transcriptional regulator